MNLFGINLFQDKNTKKISRNEDSKLELLNEIKSKLLTNAILDIHINSNQTNYTTDPVVYNELFDFDLINNLKTELNKYFHPNLILIENSHSINEGDLEEEIEEDREVFVKFILQIQDKEAINKLQMSEWKNLHSKQDKVKIHTLLDIEYLDKKYPPLNKNDYTQHIQLIEQTFGSYVQKNNYTFRDLWLNAVKIDVLFNEIFDYNSATAILYYCGFVINNTEDNVYVIKDFPANYKISITPFTTNSTIILSFKFYIEKEKV
jgi:hypothetical protein